MTRDDAFLRRHDAFVRHFCAVLSHASQNALRIKRLCRASLGDGSARAPIVMRSPVIGEAASVAQLVSVPDIATAPAGAGRSAGIDSHGHMDYPKARLTNQG
jgi:hypothetical protein